MIADKQSENEKKLRAWKVRKVKLTNYERKEAKRLESKKSEVNKL